MHSPINSFSLEEIYLQASNSFFSIGSVGHGYSDFLLCGIKIKKFSSGEIVLLNALSSIDSDYLPLSNDKAIYIFIHGWDVGCWLIAKALYLKKINHLNDKIKIETNIRRNSKVIKKYNIRREELIILVARINKRLSK